MVTENVPFKLFCLYDRNDKRGFQELEEHLKSTIRPDEISSIDDLPAGKPSKEALSRFLSSAQIVIVLLSAALFKSLHDELKDALKRAESGELRLLPVLYKPVLIEYSELGELQILPRDGKAIHGRDENERNKVWIDIVREILKIRAGLLAGTIVSIEKEAARPERDQTEDRKEQQEQDPTRPATVFVSYAPNAGQHCEQLQLLLRLRGLKIWRRDSEDLPFTGLRESAAARAVREFADAYLLYLTPEALKKPQLWLPEARAALERHEQEPEFPIVLILERVTQRRAQNSLEKLGLSKLREFIRSELEPEASSEATVKDKLRSLARSILYGTFSQRLRRAGVGKIVNAHEPYIGITTFADNREPMHRLDLELDWSDLFLGKHRLPGQEEWNELLWPALKDLKALLHQKSEVRRTLHLALKAIIPVGFAVGMMFKETTGFRIIVKTTSLLNRGELHWSTQLVKDDQPHLYYEDLPRDAASDPSLAVVEIALTNKFNPGAVDQYLRDNHLSPGHHRRYQLRGGFHPLEEEREAQSIMYELRQSLADLVKTPGPHGERVKHIHLFAGVPVALAVMIGYQLNPLPQPITVYSYGLDGIYRPACVLHNSLVS